MNIEDTGGGSSGLDLRFGSDGPGTGKDEERGGREQTLKPGDRVVLYSGRLESEVTVEVTHVEADRLGGHLVEDPETPLVQRGDHLHFREGNVMRRLD